MTRTFITRSGVAGGALAAALALGLSIAPGAPAAAQAGAARSGAARPGAVRVSSGNAAGEAQPARDAITLSTGEGQLISLPRAISDVFVADDKVADVQPRTSTRLFVFGKAGGQTTVSATDKSGTVVWQATVRVGTNMANLGQMLKIAMPEAQIVATPMNGLVVLTGTVAAPDDVEEASRLVQAFVGKETAVVTRIKTATPLQVMLRVRFAEVNRDLSKSIGFNFLTRDTSGGFLFGASQGNAGTISTNVSGQVDSGSGAGLLGTIFSTAASAAGAGSRFGFAGHALGLDILTALDLAETDGYATTLAQPTLTAISGETASFLAGGEIPIPVPQYQGVTTIEYKQYGVSLAFTPTVLGDNRISLRVRPEVSQLGATGLRIGGYSVPNIITRRAETTVELGSGQSFVVGGLLSNNAANSVDKAPFLGDLPIVGQLFRSNSWRRQQSELVIVVTPYLVKPVSDSRIALPTDGYRQPTDLGTIALDQQMAGSRKSRRAKPVAEAPVNAPTTGAPVAALPPGANRKKDAGAAPGFSFN